MRDGLFSTWRQLSLTWRCRRLEAFINRSSGSDALIPACRRMQVRRVQGDGQAGQGLHQHHPAHLRPRIQGHAAQALGTPHEGARSLHDIVE